MIDLQGSLKRIVTSYAQYNPASDQYAMAEPIDTIKAQKIEAHLITFFTQYMTQDGLDEKQVKRRYRDLIKKFAADKLPRASAEVHWLVWAVSEGRLDGTCHKLLDVCFHGLKPKEAPPPAAEAYEDVQDMDEFYNSLKRKRAGAATLTQRAVIDCLLSMLDSMKDYRQTAKEIDPAWLQKVMQTMPYITSGIGMGIYITELALLYALTHAVSTGSGWLAQSSSQRWRHLAYGMDTISYGLAQASTSLLSLFVKLNFCAFNATCYMGIGVCSAVYRALLPSLNAPAPGPASSSSASQPCTTVSLAPQHLLGGRSFETPEIKLLAFNLENYRAEQGRQLFAGLRYGNYKQAQINRVLAELQIIDASSAPLEARLQKAQQALISLNTPEMTSSGQNARLAITASLSLCETLLTPLEPKPEPAHDSAEEERRIVLFS